MNFNLSGWKLWFFLIVGIIIWPFVWFYDKIAQSIEKISTYEN